MVNLKCNECDKEFTLTEYKYGQRKRSNKNSELYCSRQCSGKARRKYATTTAQEDLDEWFKSSSDIIVGVGLATTNNNNGGEVILNSKESNVMDEHLAWAAEMAKKNPQYLTMSLSDIIKSEAQEEGVEVSNATPIAPVVISTTPIQVNPVTPVQSNTIIPTQPANQVPARWQDGLDDKEILSSVCDAGYWDAPANTMKKCNPNPEANGQFRYSVVDPVHGLIFTQNGRICYRCQGKGTLSLRNLGYNWDTDRGLKGKQYQVISADTPFSAYVASKNANGIAVQIPVGLIDSTGNPVL